MNSKLFQAFSACRTDFPLFQQPHSTREQIHSNIAESGGHTMFLSKIWRSRKEQETAREPEITKEQETAREPEITTEQKTAVDPETAKEQARAEMKRVFQDFMNGEGKLPEGFSTPYNSTFTLKDKFVLRGTPFDAYLRIIRDSVDQLNNHSGISDWLYLDNSVEINAAAEAISDWVKRHREMYKWISKKCRADDAWSLPWLVSPYGDENIIIVIDDRRRFEDMTEESIQCCKDVGISFCSIVSGCAMYDLFEQKTKVIDYYTYPNYHDETYADWSFQ